MTQNVAESHATETSTVHLIGGRLYCYGVDTNNKPFKILVNGTLRDIVYTDANGVFNLQLDLQPLNGSVATIGSVLLIYDVINAP
jgi:hypothetical protein